MRIDPEKSYSKKDLRLAFNVSATTFRRWLNEIPGLKDYRTINQNGSKRKIYFRTLTPKMVTKIMNHLVYSEDDQK